MLFSFSNDQQPNGLRYPRVGGTRQRHFAGTSFELRELLENAATPTRRVHAVLGNLRLKIVPGNSWVCRLWVDTYFEQVFFRDLLANIKIIDGKLAEHVIASIVWHKLH